MAFGHEQRQATNRVERDRVKGRGRVSITEIVRPTAQESVDVLHDVLDWQPCPFAHRQLTDALTSVLHCLARGPASEIGDVPRARSTRAHPAMVEAEEIKSLAPLRQVHDARLGRLELQPELGQDHPQRLKGALGL